MAQTIALQMPFQKAELAQLRAGDACTLSGYMYVLRDAGHVRLLEELQELGHLPYGLEGQAIFYAGPSPASAGRPFGSIGPTTSSRMDFATPQLLRAGIAATIGKGFRSEAVKRAIQETGAVYFAAVGGVAALLAKCIVSEEIISYPDLGTEALRKIEVKNLPVFVGIDTLGNCLYDIDAPAETCAGKTNAAPCAGETNAALCAGKTNVAPCAEQAARGVSVQKKEQECESDIAKRQLHKQRPHKGVFISFEGGDGVGKTTHIALLAETLRERGHEVLCLREPGGTNIGEALRSLVLDPNNTEMANETELLIYEAARAQIVSQVIAPALERGAIVLCDRFFDSTIAYQAYGRGLSRSFIDAANSFACQGIMPNRTILLRASAHGGDANAATKENLERATCEGADRLECAGIDFHTRVNKAFEQLSEQYPQRIRVVEFQEHINDTFDAIYDQVKDLFEE